MPTYAAKARKLLHQGKAIIEKYQPFTIRLTYESKKYTQPIELSVDTGYLHIGLSVKSGKHEYVSNEYTLLKDETEHHNDCRKYRRTRRNRLRYRKPRFNNRRKQEGWLAPSILHKLEAHVRLIKRIYDVCPITDVYLEAGQFDPHALKAALEGKSVPHGKEYQTGEQYGYDTVREAVFARDGYTCQICKRTPWKDKITLHRHHIGFWKGDRSNRPGNLLTVCNKCHIPANHKPKGRLYGLEPKAKGLTAATFMNVVKFEIYRQVQGFCENVNITYGTVTKHVRRVRCIEKSHANDAYCIGKFQPHHRAKTCNFEKRRRNNRVLSKFYDAKYMDSRSGKTKSGSQLSSGRTNRNHNRDGENLHPYRGKKKSKGRVSIRKTRYSIQSGDIIIFEGEKYTSGGCHNKGERVILLPKKKSVAVKKVTVLKRIGGWKPITV